MRMEVVSREALDKLKELSREFHKLPVDEQRKQLKTKLKKNDVKKAKQGEKKL